MDATDVSLVRLRDGRCVTIRPTLVEDACALQRFVRALSRESRYQRFLMGLRELPADMLMRLVRAQRGKEVALVADTGPEGDRQIVALAQYAAAGDPNACEVAVIVAEGWRRSGLATLLLRRLTQEAKRSGYRHIVADILRDNAAALGLARRFGGKLRSSPHGHLLARATATFGAEHFLA